MQIQRHGRLETNTKKGKYRRKEAVKYQHSYEHGIFLAIGTGVRVKIIFVLMGFMKNHSIIFIEYVVITTYQIQLY